MTRIMGEIPEKLRLDKMEQSISELEAKIELLESEFDIMKKATSNLAKAVDIHTNELKAKAWVKPDRIIRIN